MPPMISMADTFLRGRASGVFKVIDKDKIRFDAHLFIKEGNLGHHQRIGIFKTATLAAQAHDR